MHVGRKLAASAALGLVLSGLVAGPASAARARPGDADHDHMADSWEVAHGLDPTNRADRKADPDGDGVRNDKEFRRGSDPQQAPNDGGGFET